MYVSLFGAECVLQKIGFSSCLIHLPLLFPHSCVEISRGNPDFQCNAYGPPCSTSLQHKISQTLELFHLSN
ncbi:hypothetical protein LguiB_018007 [Lonicera macranthoides]